MAYVVGPTDIASVDEDDGAVYERYPRFLSRTGRLLCTIEEPSMVGRLMDQGSRIDWYDGDTDGDAFEALGLVCVRVWLYFSTYQVTEILQARH